jgi:hypothetical protein
VCRRLATEAIAICRLKLAESGVKNFTDADLAATLCNELDNPSADDKATAKELDDELRNAGLSLKEFQREIRRQLLPDYTSDDTPARDAFLKIGKRDK